MHESSRLGRVGRLHLLAIPIQTLARPDPDDARQADFREFAAEVKIREGFPLASARVDPFLAVACGAREEPLRKPRREE